MISVKNLNVKIVNNDSNDFTVLRDISFTLDAPEILGILGESGSGKSMLAKTISGLIEPPVVANFDSIEFEGRPLVKTADFACVRGEGISMIFQHPTSALNPVLTIGGQMVETILYHKRADNKKQALEMSASLLEETGISHPEDRLNSYPHQLSGGMNQRVMTALALATKPRLMIADEPTTALDVITQAQIISMLEKLGKSHNFAMLFITHDLSLMEKIADRVLVMYAGEIVEVIEGKALREGNVRHPCTEALKKSIPSLAVKGEKLYTIKGQIAKNGAEYDSSCIFHERCPYAQPNCAKRKPSLENGVRCFYPLR